MFALFFHHIQPQHLQIQIVVGQIRVDHLLHERQRQRHLHTLVGRTDVAGNGLADEAAGDFIQIFLISNGSHRSTPFGSVFSSL